MDGIDHVQDTLKNLKKTYLFDEDTGLIRKGIDMKKYAEILYCESEDELDELINSVIANDEEE